MMTTQYPSIPDTALSLPLELPAPSPIPESVKEVVNEVTTDVLDTVVSAASSVSSLPEAVTKPAVSHLEEMIKNFRERAHAKIHP